ncbi:hypothetical protein [Nesterenkonia sp.]|uniref:hypothetical protein n=1 Tax=Nesterenkonia sp. TaxID=704201 RepID=UPI002602E8AE|nr:hypothetical protein [Nesterenkonia sp.]
MKPPRPPARIGTALPAPADVISADLLDGWLLHTAALRSGAACSLLPGQVLMLPGRGSGGAEASFAHGVANTAGVSTVTALEDRRIRRELLKSYEIPAPESAAFSVRRGYEAALAYAESAGWPVRLKPVVGEAGIEVISDVRGPEEFAAAFEYFQTAPTRRSNFTSSSYSFTQIFMPRGRTGLAKPGYEVMVEPQIPGTKLRMLTVDGEVVSALHRGGGETRYTDVLAEIDSSVVDLARRVAGLFPDLLCVSLEVLVANPAQPLDAQQHQVLEVSERPWLHVQYQVSAQTAERIAGRILRAVDSTAGEATHPIDVDFHWEGLADAEHELPVLQRAAAAAQVHCSAEIGDDLGGSLRGRLRGSADAIALLTELAVAGRLLEDPVMWAETTPR